MRLRHVAWLVVVGVWALGTVVHANELRVTTAADLLLCAAGTGPLTVGPSAGQTAVIGDTCLLSPGTYAAVVLVRLENLTITSRSGSTSTVVTGGFSIERDGVMISELTISGAGPGILIGAPPTPAGQADEHIRIEDNFINGNGGDGVMIVTPGAVDSFDFQGNEFRGNAGSGVDFTPAVTRLTSMTFTGNTFDSNAGSGINFLNTGVVNDISINQNEIVRSGAHGVFVAPTVTSVRRFDVDGNLIRANGLSLGGVGGSGVTFASSGQVEATITDNISGSNGITGNACAGVFVDGASALPGGPFYGGAVTTADLVIDGNVINDNGFVGSCPGVVFVNASSVDNLEVTNNTIDQNGADGVAIMNGADLDGADIRGNTVRNNGASGPFAILTRGNGFTVIVPGDVSNVSFADNVMSQNSLHGSFIASTGNDVSDVSYQNERYDSNGTGVALGSGGTISSFGSISNVDISGSSAQSNGGPGFFMDANGNILSALGLAPMNFSDLSRVSLRDNELDANGSSAPTGSGDGAFLQGDKVDNIEISGNTASGNDDNGIHINGTDDVSGVQITNNTLSDNDRNNDAVGAGVRVESAQDVDGVTVSGNTLNNNDDGITIQSGGQSVNDVMIENNTQVNNNSSNGIEVISPDDMSNVSVNDNTVSGNAINLLLRANNRGRNNVVSGNEFRGNSGTGIALDALGVTISNNTIRDHTTGILATRGEDNHVVNNNIVQNGTGIDASGLGFGGALDATNNWWGEPSGPSASSNPGGLGNRVTGNVTFTPFAAQPVVATGANFQIVQFDVPPNVPVGQPLTVTATVQNTGTEEGTQDIVLRIRDNTGTVVDEQRQSSPLNPQASTTITLTHTFGSNGNFTVEVSTSSDALTKTLSVGSGGTTTPPGGRSIAEALDANGNNKLDDNEIKEALRLWIQGATVPGTNLTISDQDIKRLIAMWIGGTPVR